MLCFVFLGELCYGSPGIMGNIVGKLSVHRKPSHISNSTHDSPTNLSDTSLSQH